MKPESVLFTVLSPRMISAPRDERFWSSLAERVHEVWFTDSQEGVTIWKMVDALMRVVADPQNWINVRDSDAKALAFYCARKVKLGFEQGEFSWEELVHRNEFLRLVGQIDIQRSLAIARAVGKAFPALTEDQLGSIFPGQNYLAHYALGAIEVENMAYAALITLRRVRAISKRTASCDVSPEDIADLVLALMNFPLSHGLANDQIVTWMERLSSMPGGAEQIKRIEREAPSFRHGT